MCSFLIFQKLMAINALEISESDLLGHPYLFYLRSP